MRTCAAAGITNIADYVTPFNSHTLFYSHPGQMGKTSSQATTMIDFYKITVLLIICTNNYKSICRCNYLLTESSRYIQPFMKFNT